MKTIATLSLAAMLAAGTATSAGAFGLPTAGLIEAERAAAQGGYHAFEPTRFDHCHGRTSGTAHPLCGTATGGPVGGLF